VASLVVGIFPQSDPAALESALSAQQIDLSKVKVVGAAPDAPESSQLEFVDVIEDMDSNSLSDDMTQGVGVWDETGTSVPGLGGGRQATLGDFRHPDHPAKRYFAAFSIPTDEVDKFGDALAEGRAVVLYPDAGASAESIAQAFRAAGLRNVRSY
jgi:ABC-type nitrate/sulfonate/bicarbonate transport system substrate-binding protein